MGDLGHGALSRRGFMGAGLAMLGAAGLAGVGTSGIGMAAGVESTSTHAIAPGLFWKALAALQRHGNAVAHHDRIAIADFTVPSVRPRFHLVDLASGATSTLRVAHGSGSDPDHTGWLKLFSNDLGSNASSEGAFLTADYYVGKHGLSQRLSGLDPTNSNAFDRALVVHSAWYANADMIEKHGQLGRSQGCFAVGEADLEQVFARLGDGRMIYAAKV